MNTKFYTLRTASPNDADAIAALTQSAYSKWINVIGRKPLPMEVDYNEAILNHRFDLLFHGETLCALMETTNKGDHLLIENLCVSPQFQRQGLGKRLLAFASDLTREQNLRTIRLDTNKLFTGNVDLYRRAGFTVEWETPISGGIHVHMRKDVEC